MICSSSLAVSPNKLFKVLFLPSPGPLKVQLYREVVGEAIEEEREGRARSPGQGHVVRGFAFASGFLLPPSTVQARGQVKR